MKIAYYYLLIVSAEAFATQSSLNSLAGDRNTAPIQSQSNDVPGDKVVPPMDGSKIDDIVTKAQAAWKEEQEKTSREATDQEQIKENADIPTTLPKTVKDAREDSPPPKLVPMSDLVRPIQRPRLTTKVVRFERPSGEAITVFKSNIEQLQEETITLPSGAHAFGRVKFGEEVTANNKTEVLVELDYAFLGPNRSVVELNGCTVWVSVDSNFHTQKIKGSMQDMTCTMPSGRVFTITIGGPLVDVASGYAGVESDLIMKGPAKAAAFNFLAEITKAYGLATAAAQTRTDVVGGDRYSDKATNVTGDKKAYIEGKVLEANGDFLKYIASFFESLQPTLALPPGTKVHLINRFNVKIPKAFFKKGASHG